jgi:hypothetical protein
MELTNKLALFAQQRVIVVIDGVWILNKLWQ